MGKVLTFEDLRNWFSPSHPKGGWKRINAKGEAIGPCAREPGEPKPKCMSNEKRAMLSKEKRAAAVRVKRKHDPNPERKGEPIMVSNFGKGKINEEYDLDPTDKIFESLDLLLEKNKPTSPEKWADCIAQAKAKFDVYPCVPLDSMAITRKGPAYRDQLKIGDDILTYNIQTDRLEWKPIVNLHDFEDAPLVEMKKSTGFSIRCTPNHKWVVQHGIAGDTKFVNTELLETREIMDKKNHKRLVCCSMLEDSTSSSDLGEWSKTDSWTEKVLNMSRDQREVYLASAIVYDGHDCGVSTKISGRHTMGFSQKNEDHFWSAILAAYLNGYHVSYSDKNVGDMRSATIIRNKKHHSTQNVVFTSVENEFVWCPETENNTWVMVQNGWITITGNSAYANGWAAQCYKRKGGKWKSVSESRFSLNSFINKDEILSGLSSFNDVVSRNGSVILEKYIVQGNLKNGVGASSIRSHAKKYGAKVKSTDETTEFVFNDEGSADSFLKALTGKGMNEANECEGRATGKPWRTPGERKKFAVCVDNKIVRFGDPGLSIKRDQPGRLKNFRARHGCDKGGLSRDTPKYWSCQMWRKDKSVTDLTKGE